MAKILLDKKNLLFLINFFGYSQHDPYQQLEFFVVVILGLFYAFWGVRKIVTQDEKEKKESTFLSCGITFRECDGVMVMCPRCWGCVPIAYLIANLNIYLDLGICGCLTHRLKYIWHTLMGYHHSTHSQLCTSVHTYR